jgi:hypothetical protein
LKQAAGKQRQGSGQQQKSNARQSKQRWSKASGGKKLAAKQGRAKWSSIEQQGKSTVRKQAAAKLNKARQRWSKATHGRLPRVEATLSCSKWAPLVWFSKDLQSAKKFQPFWNSKIYSSPASNMLKLFDKVEGTKVNNFPFYLNIKIKKYFELQFREWTRFWICFEF